MAADLRRAYKYFPLGMLLIIQVRFIFSTKARDVLEPFLTINNTTTKGRYCGADILSAQHKVINRNLSTQYILGL